MTKRAIIFDCDGVLINSEVIHISVERAYLSNIGLDYEITEFLTKFVGLNNDDFISTLELDYAALNKGPFPDSFMEEITPIAWKRFKDELKAVNGLTDLLDHFMGAVAVASSSGLDILHKKLHMTGLSPYFDPYIYSGDQVINGKPAPDIFLLAAQGINHAPPDCIVIEDSVNGVKSGLAAGMNVWGFTGGGHGDAELGNRLQTAGAHAVFSTFAEINAAL